LSGEKRRPNPRQCRRFDAEEIDLFYEWAGKFEYDAGMDPAQADQKAVDLVIDHRLEFGNER